MKAENWNGIHDDLQALELEKPTNDILLTVDEVVTKNIISSQKAARGRLDDVF